MKLPITIASVATVSTRIVLVHSDKNNLVISKLGKHYFSSQDNTLYVGAKIDQDNSNGGENVYSHFITAQNEKYVSPFNHQIIRSIYDACKRYDLAAVHINIDDVHALYYFVRVMSYIHTPSFTFQKKESWSFKCLEIITPHEVCEIQLKKHLNAGICRKEGHNLMQTPANICGTEYVASKLISAADDEKVVILDRDALQDKGMECFLAVGRASFYNPPKMVIVEYRNDPKNDHIISVIGKGIVYDTGGLNIKNDMFDMKEDMGGAASVIGLLKMVKALQLKVNINFIVALAENAVGSLGYRSSDVYKNMGGKHVEIGDTDAEGRLLLCDAISYVQKEYQERNTIFTLATLTGAVRVGLGLHFSAVFSNSEHILRQTMDSSNQYCEYVWPMPLSNMFDEYNQSEIADVRNIPSTRYGGHISAACFLKSFIYRKDTVFTHIDIARICGMQSNHPYFDMCTLTLLDTLGTL